MKPMTSQLLTAATRDLANARSVHAVSIPEQAARLAYYAMFHSAQALIFERTDRLPKTHKGTRAQFHRLARNDVHLGSRLSAMLTSSYELKNVADYEIGIDATITAEEASEAITDAELFVARVRFVLAPDHD